MKNHYILIITFFALSCSNNVKKEVTSPEQDEPVFTFATWTNAPEDFEANYWTDKLKNYKEVGISEVLVKGEADVLKEIVSA